MRPPMQSIVLTLWSIPGCHRDHLGACLQGHQKLPKIWDLASCGDSFLKSNLELSLSPWIL